MEQGNFVLTWEWGSSDTEQHLSSHTVTQGDAFTFS